MFKVKTPERRNFEQVNADWDGTILGPGSISLNCKNKSKTKN